MSCEKINFSINVLLLLLLCSKFSSLTNENEVYGGRYLQKVIRKYKSCKKESSIKIIQFIYIFIIIKTKIFEPNSFGNTNYISNVFIFNSLLNSHIYLKLIKLFNLSYLIVWLIENFVYIKNYFHVWLWNILGRTKGGYQGLSTNFIWVMIMISLLPKLKERKDLNAS